MSSTSTHPTQRDDKGVEPLLYEECAASVSSKRQPQRTDNTSQLCTGDANQISNPNPSISFLFYAFLYRVESMHFGQKSHDTKKQAWLYRDTRGLPTLG
jgi:hypothetical protein